VLGFVMVWEVFILKNLAKDWLGFLPLLRRVYQDTSCVRVHGYYSCDLGLLQPLCYYKMVMVQFMLNSKEIKIALAYHKIQQDEDDLCNI
jgi:hypothetical protein